MAGCIAVFKEQNGNHEHACTGDHYDAWHVCETCGILWGKKLIGTLWGIPVAVVPPFDVFPYAARTNAVEEVIDMLDERFTLEPWQANAFRAIMGVPTR